MSLINIVLSSCPFLMKNLSVYKSLPTPLSLEVRQICAELIEDVFIERESETQGWSITNKWDWEVESNIIGVEDLITAEMFINQIKAELDAVLNQNPTLPEINALRLESREMHQTAKTRPVEFVREIRKMVQNEIAWLNENIKTIPVQPQQSIPLPTDPNNESPTYNYKLSPYYQRKIKLSTMSLTTNVTSEKSSNIRHLPNQAQPSQLHLSTKDNTLRSSESSLHGIEMPHPQMNLRPSVINLSYLTTPSFLGTEHSVVTPTLLPPISPTLGPEPPQLIRQVVMINVDNDANSFSPNNTSFVPTAVIAPHPQQSFIKLDVNKSNHFYPFQPQPNSRPECQSHLPVSTMVSNLDSLASKLEGISSKITFQIQAVLSSRTSISFSGEQLDRSHTHLTIQSEYASLVSAVQFSNNLFQRVLDTILEKNLKSVWSYQNQCESIGLPPPGPRINLEELFPLCQKLSASFYAILQSIYILNQTGNIGDLAFLFAQGVSYFKMFLGTVFLVKQQPPLVISAGTYLSKPSRSSVKANLKPISAVLLCCSSLPFMNKLKQSVEISLINEMHTKALVEEGLDALEVMIKDGHSGMPGKFWGATAVLSSDPKGKGPPEADFDEARLMSRTGREAGSGSLGKGNSNVMEQKCCILFTLKINLFGELLSVWTTSLPVCVSTHGSQKGLGMAVAIRDYLTSSMIRTPFEIPHPDTIAWSELSQVIQILFQKDLEDDGMKLNSEQLNCIKYKVKNAVCNTPFSNMFSFEEMKWIALHLHSFSHGVSGKKFTFWDWLLCTFETLKLKHMDKMWKDKLIMGFVDRSTAERKLSIESGTTVGTFLLRFSDTLPGGISIVVLKQDGKAHHLTPFTKEELKVKCLANLIKEKELAHGLRFIYGTGNIPKHHILGQFEENYTVPGYE